MSILPAFGNIRQSGYREIAGWFLTFNGRGRLDICVEGTPDRSLSLEQDGSFREKGLGFGIKKVKFRLELPSGWPASSKVGAKHICPFGERNVEPVLMSTSATDLRFKGKLERIVRGSFRGWVSVLDLTSAEPLDVRLKIDDRVLAATRADQFRVDVYEAGFGNGFSGFTIPIPTKLDGLSYDSAFTVEALLGDQWHILPGSPYFLNADEAVFFALNRFFACENLALKNSKAIADYIDEIKSSHPEAGEISDSFVLRMGTKRLNALGRFEEAYCLAKEALKWPESKGRRELEQIVLSRDAYPANRAIMDAVGVLQLPEPMRTEMLGSKFRSMGSDSGCVSTVAQLSEFLTDEEIVYCLKAFVKRNKMKGEK